MSYKKAKDCRDIVEEIVGGHLQEQQVFTRNKTSNRSMLLTRLKQSYQFNVGELTRQLNDLGARLSVDGMGVPGRIGATETELGNLVEMQLKMQLNHTAAANMYDQVVSQLREGIDPPQVEAMVDEDMTIRQLRMTRDNAEVAANVQEQQLGVGHPRAREARLTVEGYQKKLEETTEERKATARTQLVSTLRSQTQSTQEDLDAVTKRVNDSKSALGELSNKMASYLTLQDEEEALRELLNDVNEELANITQVETLQDRSSVGWAMHPEEPDKPSFPKLPMTLAFAIMLGLGISVGIAFLRELLDTSVRSPRDIARVGQMNLLGMVNDESEDPQSAGAHLPLVIFETPTSMLAEQLRQVRTRLQHAASLDTTRSILVTSPSPGDGKTTIAVNLAAGLALNGRRILLVDSNFRRPEIHKIFGLGNEMGFGDVLNSVDNFDQAIRQTQVPNLDVLVSGPKPANATELMESQLLIDFIERALEEYDHVIFDSGPILVVSETVALAPRVDGVVTVVRAKANSRGLLQRMRDALRQVRAEHLGVVLNAVRSQGGGYYRRNIKTYYEYQNGHAS
jgi:capsular exopolysaccharide synthesis family protein